MLKSGDRFSGPIAQRALPTQAGLLTAGGRETHDRGPSGGRDSSELGSQLEASITLGVRRTYQPVEPVVWRP
jgi:hypothetical protein